MQALGKETKSLTEQLAEQLKLTQKQAAADRQRLKELQQLASAEPLDAKQMKQAEDLLNALENRYGSLGAAVDKVTGKITGLDRAMNAVGGMIDDDELKGLESTLDEMLEKQQQLKVIAEREIKGGGHAGATARNRRSQARRQLPELESAISDIRNRITELRKDQAKPVPGGSDGTPRDPAAEALAQRQADAEQRAADELAAARIKATKDGLAEELALIREQHRQKLRDLEEEGVLTDDLREKLGDLLQARIDEATAAEQARQQQDSQRAIEQAADEAKRMAEARSNAEASVADRLAEARINATKTGLDRELALLDLRHEQELRRLEEAGVLTAEMAEQMKQLAELEADALIASSAAADGSNLPGGTFNGLAAAQIYGGDDYQQKIADATEESRKELVKVNDNLKFAGGGLLLG